MKKAICNMLGLMVARILLSGCAGTNTSETAAKTEVQPQSQAQTSATKSSDDYPSRPLSAVVAWKVGGGQDLMARAVAASFKDFANGQTIVINNLDGASSVQGVTEYMSYDSDGYNLLTWATAQTIKTHMQETQYSINDFQPICSFVSDSPYILVKKDSPFNTLSDLVDYAKTNPGKLTMGNSGAGGGNHLAALQLCLEAGIEINHIAYEGGSASAQSTLSGEVDCSMNMPAEGLTNVEAGDLRILCVLSEERSPLFKDVPTAKESGINVVNEQSRGFMIQKDAPEGITEKLEAIFKQVAESETFQAQAKDLNMNVKWMGIEDYTKALQDEDTLYKDIIQANALGDKY